METEINDIEMFFQWWLNEMVEAGYIKSYIREGETLIADNSISYGRIKRFKSKESKVELFNLFPEVKYTYDYRIIWDQSAEFLFYETVEEAHAFQFGKPVFVAHYATIEDEAEIISYVDVKPTNSVMRAGGKVSSSITFPFKQRLIWMNEKLYINKVVPIPMSGTGFSSALFIKTFVPARYLITNKSGAARKINFEYINLSAFVHKRTTYLENLIANTK